MELPLWAMIFLNRSRERIYDISALSNEGHNKEIHDIIDVGDMREALKERPVKGTTTAVSLLNESSRNLQVHKRKHFSELHNFRYEESGLRAWKAYAVGPRRLIAWQSLYVKHQGPTNVSLNEGQGFFETTETRELPTRKLLVTENDALAPMFVCPKEGCSNAFDSFSVAYRRRSTQDSNKKDWNIV